MIAPTIKYVRNYSHATSSALPVLPRKKPKQKRSKEMVKAIVQATARVLREGGADAVSTNRVAKVAGVTKPVVYQRFDSKRDLYRAVLEDIGERMQASVFHTAAAATTPRESTIARSTFPSSL